MIPGDVQVPTSGSSMLSAPHHYILALEELPILSKKSGVPAVGGNASSEMLRTTFSRFTLHTYQSPAVSHLIPGHGDTGIADQSVSLNHAHEVSLSHNIQGNCSAVTSHETICWTALPVRSTNTSHGSRANTTGIRERTVKSQTQQFSDILQFFTAVRLCL